MAQLSETISPLTGPLRAAVICFFVFQLMGLVFAILALVAGTFSTSSRRASWWSFIISWAVFAFSYTLLLFEGHAFEGTPSRSICMLQSSLTYGAPPFSAACALNLVLESLIAPYVIFITVILISLGVALTDPDVKFTVVAYCSLENHVPGRITAGLVVILIIAVLFFN
ncbi:MAG: hypothetical protein NXY57DRAFT_1044788, partial [Lentinula lateritia]